MKKGQYVIVRGSASGVFAGILYSRRGSTVTLLDARRLWQWAGAASLSELSQHGPKRPAECKFPMEVPMVMVLDSIEILVCSERARAAIKDVPIWSA